MLVRDTTFNPMVPNRTGSPLPAPSAGPAADVGAHCQKSGTWTTSTATTLLKRWRRPARKPALPGEIALVGWTQEDLATHPKSDPGKLAIAARLRRETTLSIKAIAARVQLGASKGANSNLHRWMRANARENPAQGQLAT